jgi:hypothetical protein
LLAAMNLGAVLAFKERPDGRRSSEQAEHL